MMILSNALTSVDIRFAEAPKSKGGNDRVKTRFSLSRIVQVNAHFAAQVASSFASIYFLPHVLPLIPLRTAFFSSL